MKIKEGVVLAGLRLSMRTALIEADKIWRNLGHELVVTAGLDGIHSAGSLHYYGYALDFRSRYFSSEQKDIAANRLQSRIGDEYYDVIVHETHIHVEYQKILEK